MSSASALKVNWTFGFSKNVTNGVHSLTTPNRNAIFYLSSHSGVIYDFENRTQMILQGHCNPISCCAVSEDKRWIVTADMGDDSILVVWDSNSGAPVKTIFAPHAYGIRGLDITSDSLYVATLSEPDQGAPQEVAIWDWTNETEDAALMRKVIPSNEVQNQIKFDRNDNAELVTTGAKSVCFWTWMEDSLDVYIGKVSKADLGNSKGSFSSTIFLPGTGNALTTTKDGSAIIWESDKGGAKTNDHRKLRTVSKVIRLVESAINFATTTSSGYVVICCKDGAVRFYDFSLRVEAWFEDLMAGSVNSVSFAVQDCPTSDAGKPGAKFWVPDFMVGTLDAFIVGVESACFDEVSPDDRRGTLLMQGLTDYISNVACHPQRPLVAFASYNGSLQIWDYDMKLLMNLREFNSRDASATAKSNTAAARLEAHNFLRPVTVAFEPHGEFVAVGFTSGHVKFLDINTFEDLCSFAPTTDSVFDLKFSPSGVYLACHDDSNHVLLFKRTSEIDPETLGEEAGSASTSGVFTYLGRVRGHSGKITGLEFGRREEVETLVSVGEDRRVVEYDIEASTVIGGVQPMKEETPPTLDLTAFPSSMMWAPSMGAEGEEKFIVANDEFKLKEYNLESKQCRKTCISPTYGGPVNKMLPLPKNGAVKHYAYSTASKVIGVGTLPMTGSPSEVTGLVAHPDIVSSIAVSHDGRFVFSCGGNDLSVNMWEVDTSELVPITEREEPAGDIKHFLELLEGGEGGAVHSDIKDYFYYCQLRTQGEGSMEKRSITGKIPVTEMPSLARAAGFYPSEEEVANMVAEVRYSKFMETGQLEEEIGLNDFIKLYINHRPVLPLNNAQVLSAFETVSRAGVGEDGAVAWADLAKLLVSEGETIATGDLEAYLEALVGKDGMPEAKEEYDGYRFTDKILGFEE